MDTDAATVRLSGVIVGSVGGRDRQDYTAVGSPVDLVARLCAAAEPNDTRT